MSVAIQERRNSVAWCFGLVLLLGARFGAASVEGKQVDFNREIRPILADRCFACHGPDAAERQGGLRLDDAEAVLEPADSGELAIVPGDPSSSELLRRIESEDEGDMMPPPETNKPLTAQEKELLRRWIEEGAIFAPHWSLVPPLRHAEPAVASGAQVRDPIDSFLIAAIEEAGLVANGDADRRSLIRRLTFDLTGLPPTIQEIRDFESDTRPDAYERVVDRLLRSPRFGEHFARYWLDLVRYGDTHGLHLDNYREMWPYRDWVINALNENKPFDQFITEQLAGDLLPGDHLQHKIASGFNRLNITTSEGGSIYEEVFARNVIDRTDAFGTIFLGYTTGCSVCHDHKFDPITQRDYYSLSAFFNSLDGQALDGNRKDHPPVERVPTQEHLDQLEEVRAMREKIAIEMLSPIATVDRAQEDWEKQLQAPPTQPPQWVELHPEVVSAEGASSLEVLDDRSIRVGGEAPAKESITIEAVLPKGTKFQLMKLDVLTDTPEEFAGRGVNGNAVLSEIEVAAKTSEESDFAAVSFVYGKADYEQKGGKFNVSYAIDGKVDNDAGWAIGGHEKPGGREAWFVTSTLLGNEEAEVRLRVTLKFQSQWAAHDFKRFRLSVSDSLPSVPVDQQLKVGPWHSVGPFEIETADAGYIQVFASHDRKFDRTEKFTYRDRELFWQQRDDFVEAAANALPVVDQRPSVTVLHQRITAPSAEKITLLLGTEDGYQVWLNGKRVAEQSLARDMRPLSDEVELDLVAGDNDLYLKVICHDGPAGFSTALRSPSAPVPQALRDLAAKNSEDRTDKEREALKAYYRKVVTTHPDWLVMRDMWNGLAKREEEIRNSMPTTLVWKEVSPPRVARILQRGEYDKPGDEVSRKVPSAFPPMAANMPRDRLGLAQWLVMPEHPLTARVAVNRFWQQLFGTGIVRTSEDFGVQGSPPSHPELLDSLAVEFRESGWDVKKFMKRLVMTSAYRRSSHANSEQLSVDPGNRLLARGPRFRLDAEMIRDAALYTSGLLVEKLGGPSVKPPQPAGLWRAVGYVGSNTSTFTADTGDKVYRRSVYTFWKRTSAPPQFSTFDAPSRESCTARRERTNTPMQALMLMNEPQYLEASLQLASRVQTEFGGKDLGDKLADMFELVTSHVADDRQRANLEKLYGDIESYYKSNTDLLKEIGAESAEMAAMMMVASTILNTDAALNK